MWHWLYSTSNNYVICDDGEGAGLYDGEGRAHMMKRGRLI